MDSGSRAPLVPTVGVIALVPDFWAGTCQVRHQVVSRLAKWFNVVWMDPAVEWRDALSRFKPREKSNGALPLPRQGFSVYDPGPWLPRFYHPAWLAQATDHARLNRARRTLLHRGCQKIVLYAWRPQFVDAIDRVAHDLSCYHIDDEYSFSPVETPMDSSEERLMKRAGQVIIHSPALMAKKGHLNPQTIEVPNGVDFKAFSGPVTEPADLAKVPHPRIGYVGVIKKTLDWELLRRLVSRHPEWHFVFVGPMGNVEGQEQLVEEVIHMPNVRYLGGKPASALPAYMQHLKVGLLPYLVNDYTHDCYPLKMHEYLAAGLPVIGSPIRTLLDFQEVVQIASTLEEWSVGIAKALEPESNSADLIRARRNVAAQYDWDRLVERIAAAFCERLALPLQERLPSS